MSQASPIQDRPPIEDPPPEELTPPQVQIRVPERTPVITYSIMAVTIGVFILQMITQTPNGYDLPSAMFMKINELILAGEWWRLITPILVHANLVHIGFNMFALRAFGVGLEGFYGHRRFLLLYLVSGFTGVAASFVFTDNPSVGASTAIFGVLGANGVLAYQNQRVFGDRARQVVNSIIRIAALNLLLGLMPGIDNWGHIGGLLGGVMVSWFGGPVYRLGGSALDMRLEDQRSFAQFLRAAALTVLVFGGLILVEVWALN